MTFTSLRALDDVYRLAQVEAFSAGPVLDGLSVEVAALPAETIEELGAALDALADVMVDLDRFAQRIMGVWLTQSPALVAVPAPLRTLVASTVISYEGKQALLRERVSAALQRNDRSTAEETTVELLRAAECVLAARAELRRGVLALARAAAEQRLPTVERMVANRALPTELRDRWLRARVDLRAVADAPAAILQGRFAERLHKMPPPPDDPVPESTINRVSLLDID